MAERLLFIFQVILYVGLGLPLLNLILGAIFSSGSGSGQADAGGVDLDIDVDAGLDLDMDIDASADVELDFGDGDSSGSGKVGGRPGGWRSPIQFNLYCLCLAMVIFGATGVFAVSTLPAATVPFGIAAGAALAIAAYCLLYRLVVRRLQKNDPKALNMRDLLYKQAVVTFRITKESPGKIQTRDAVGAFITYAAQLDPDICKTSRIDEAERVTITEVDAEEQICYVVPAQQTLFE